MLREWFLSMKKTSGRNVNKSAKNRFLILGAGRPHVGQEHSILRQSSILKKTIDWLLEAVTDLNPEIIFVGGYKFQEISNSYPNFQYVFNPLWYNTGPAYSLLNVSFQPDTNYYITYSDILFRKSFFNIIAKIEADIVIVIDKNWKKRYAGRQQNDYLKCEKANTLEKQIISLGSNINVEKSTYEFIGFAKLSPTVIKYITENSINLKELLRNGKLSDLIEVLRSLGYHIKYKDIKGDWAELNAPGDLTKFILGSKADTLSRLSNMLKKSTIEKQLSFYTSEWFRNKSSILSQISLVFKNEKLIIRSSCANEDNFESSSAGVYKSILNVDINNISEINDSISMVIESYKDKNPLNQVLIQPMVDKILISGVILTKTIGTGAPYYVLNYDDISHTSDSITSGLSQNHKTLLILKNNNIDFDILPDFAKVLLTSIKEIENLLNFDALDIEFAIDDKNKVHIFQVRPIVINNNENLNNCSDLDIYKAIEVAKDQFINLQEPGPFILGKKSMYGIMPDWNPAEIIGTKPNLLAISLYRFLIMDEIWAIQRKEFGYRDVRPCQLLITFCGHPYIDIRASFNSFIPSELDNSIAEKLVDFCLNWLEQNPYLHDKVEFDVVPTCYTLDFEKWENRLSANNQFSKIEIKKIGESLKKITKSAFTRLDFDLAQIEILSKRFKIIKAKNINPLDKALLLLEDCKNYGTLAFSHLARAAFIGVALLKSAVDINLISKKAYNNFLKSVNTITDQFTKDAFNTSENKMHWNDFKEIYGHLRPGTYEINSLCYAENSDYFLKQNNDLIHKKENYENQSNDWEYEKMNFIKSLEKQELYANNTEIEGLIRKAIESREYAKFIFTRNLSEALNCFVEYGEKLGINRKHLSNITLDKFILVKTGNICITNLHEYLYNEAIMGQNSFNLANKIEFPQIISKSSDFEIFSYLSNQPNYIGNDQITAPCFLLEEIKPDDFFDFSGYIILIKQADPGYDWLFSKNIAGLITMWGGVNSHIAIRAAEFQLPSAIGVGELEFNRIKYACMIELNTLNQRITILK